jgi:hypothetical protein
MNIILTEKKISMINPNTIIKKMEIILNSQNNLFGRELLIDFLNSFKKQMKQNHQIKVINSLINFKNRIRNMRYNISLMRN